VNDDLLITNETADAQDNDPWTFFGSYSDADTAIATELLREAAISFHVTNDPSPEASLMPHCLWVRDEHTRQARSILVPHFQRNAREA
jgi:hypothetical protein